MKSFPLTKATPSQLEVMELVKGSKERLFIYWLGGVRAGKSFGSAMAFMEHQRDRTDATYLIMAYTQTQALTIYGDYFRTIGTKMGYEIKVVRGAQPRIDVKDNGNTFLIKGADKAGRDASIQGLTVDGVLCDEVVLLDRPTVHQAEARASKSGALRIFTSNKANEYHWTSKYYVERIKSGAINGKLLDCRVQDNPHVDADYVAERCSEYEGNTLKRFMENEHTLDGMPLYNAVMGLPAVEGPATPYVSIYGHPGGYEVVQAVLTGEGLCVTSAGSLSNLVKPMEWLQQQYGNHRPQVLLNRSQGILARWLRRAHFPVRGYKEGYQAIASEALTKACARQALWIDDRQSSLVEAIRTYHKPLDPPFLCIRALEALGWILSPLIRHAA